MKNMGVLSPRVSHASHDASLAAVAGRRGACATLGGRRTGGGKAWVGVLFCQECFETGTPVSDGNE